MRTYISSFSFLRTAVLEEICQTPVSNDEQSSLLVGSISPFVEHYNLFNCAIF